jgi:protein involved in plasmid replication-relaxation
MTQAAYTITEADREMLLALRRFHYLTAAQVNRLLYPNNNDQNRYVQRRLKRLVDNEYLLRLRALPMPRYGQAPHVFTLGRRGRTYLQQLGYVVEPYFRPSEERRATENSPFMIHRLAAIDVMIAADLLCQAYPRISCPRMLSERELKRDPLRVQVASLTTGGARDVAVIPDAWFQLTDGVENPYSIAVELDRSTEDQKVWRQKVAAYVAWANGPYMQAFDTDNITVAVVCPDIHRVGQLIDWTRKELQARETPSFAEVFMFTAASPVTTSAHRFFFDKVWFSAETGEAMSLVDFLPTPNESGVVFQTA